jgi:hypothetical protein
MRFQLARAGHLGETDVEVSAWAWRLGTSRRPLSSSLVM